MRAIHYYQARCGNARAGRNRVELPQRAVYLDVKCRSLLTILACQFASSCIESIPVAGSRSMGGGYGYRQLPAVYAHISEKAMGQSMTCRRLISASVVVGNRLTGVIGDSH